MKRLSKFFSSTALFTTLAISAGPANAVIQINGPTHPVYTIPTFYQDLAGLALAPCLDQNTFCVLTPDFDPLLNATPLPITTTGPISDTNFPNEVFYFLADTKMNVQGPGGGDVAVLRIALEASFLAVVPNGPLVFPGNGSTFLRINLKKMAGLTPNSSFTVTHPYGTFPFTTDATGNTVLGQAGQAFRTEDPFAGAVPGVFNALLPATTTNVGPFIVSSLTPGGAATPVTAPDGNKYIGNPNVTSPVTGSPAGNNVFRIDGPNIGGPGVNTIQTTLFNLSGKLIGLQVDSPVAGNDFGTWKVGSPAPAKTYTVTNLSSTTFAPTFASSNAAEFAFNQGTCTAALAPNGTCTFTVTFTPAAPDGAKSSTISLSNAAVPTANVPVTGTGDSIAPTLAVPQLSIFTKGTTAAISGTATDNAGVPIVTVLNGATVLGTPTVTGGAWSFSPTVTQNSVTTLTVTATDNAQPLPGNAATPVSVTITSDNVPPAVSVSAPAPGLSKNNNPTLSFTANDPLSGVAITSVKLDSNPTPICTANCNNLALGSPVVLPDGQHSVTVEATDAAGNLGSSTANFTVDATPPVITVTSPKPVNGRIGSVSPALAFSVADANAAAQNTVVKLDGATLSPAPASLGPFAAGSSHTLTVDATDAAGNAAPTSSVTFTVILADGRILTLGASPPTIADALVTLKHAVGLSLLTGDAFAHADVAPLDANGVPNPNGTVDIADALIILKKVVGLITTF